MEGFSSSLPWSWHRCRVYFKSRVTVVVVVVSVAVIVVCQQYLHCRQRVLVGPSSSRVSATTLPCTSVTKTTSLRQSSFRSLSSSLLSFPLHQSLRAPSLLLFVRRCSYYAASSRFSWHFVCLLFIGIINFSKKRKIWEWLCDFEQIYFYFSIKITIVS